MPPLEGRRQTSPTAGNVREDVGQVIGQISDHGGFGRNGQRIEHLAVVLERQADATRL
jgi:hypothetical protein